MEIIYHKTYISNGYNLIINRDNDKKLFFNILMDIYKKRRSVLSGCKVSELNNIIVRVYDNSIYIDLYSGDVKIKPTITFYSNLPNLF